MAITNLHYIPLKHAQALNFSDYLLKPLYSKAFGWYLSIHKQSYIKQHSSEILYT
ncbi:MAG: hypothetical protein V4557_00065 [Bacteroidota bacterium]